VKNLLFVGQILWTFGFPFDYAQGFGLFRATANSGQAPSTIFPAPNDNRSLSFDYTQDIFGTGQAGQAFLLRINF